MHVPRLMLILQVCFFQGLAIGAGSSKERFQQALASLDRGELEEGQRLLEGLYTEEPSNLLYAFNLAQISYLQKNYKRADELYALVAQSSSPLALPAALYRAQADMDQELWIDAEASLALLSDRELPSQLAQSYADTRRELIKGMTQTTRELLHKGSLKAALPWVERLALLSKESRWVRLSSILQQRLEQPDQNLPLSLHDFEDESYEAPLDSKAGTVKIAWELGSSTNLYADASGRETASLWSSLGLDGRSALITWHGLDGQARLSTSLSAAAESSSYRYGLTEAALLMGTQLSDAIYVSVSPSLGLQSNAATSLWYNEGLSLMFEDQLSPRLIAGLRSSFHALIPKNQNYQYLEGNDLAFDAFLSLNLSSFYLSPYVYWEQIKNHNLIDTDYLLPLSYQGMGGGVQLSYRSSEKTKFSFECFRTYRNYAETAIPDQTQRQDLYTSLMTKFTYEGPEDLSWILKASFTRNISSLDSQSQVADKNYQQRSVSMGVQWER